MGRLFPIPRRAVLRGLGAAIALPWLEAMSPKTLLGEGNAPAARSPVRMAFLYVPNGMHMPDWKPGTVGPLGQLPPTLAPLERHKSSLMVLSELALNGGRPLGDGPGDHARAAASFLTAAHPFKTDGKSIRNGVSVDQVAAEKIGRATRLPSIELGCEPSAQSGNCDSGYSCAYSSNASWRTPTTPLTKETNPRAVFERLFGNLATDGDRKGAARRERAKKSILDFVAEEAGDLRGSLGEADHRKLDEYLYAVREIERRIEHSERLAPGEAHTAAFERPRGIPAQYEDHVMLMFDMLVLAFQTDSTRIATFMYTNEGSNRSYATIGVRSGHHELSHHGRNKEKQAGISKINRYHVTLLAHLLDRLAAIPEADGTLLDRSMIVYGSGLGDGDRHNHDDLPILLAGKGGGTLRSGRHVRYSKDTPLANLYLAMLDRAGASVKSFGDSTGRLQGLG
jgi:hypothetical protein